MGSQLYSRPASWAASTIWAATSAQANRAAEGPRQARLDGVLAARPPGPIFRSRTNEHVTKELPIEMHPRLGRASGRSPAEHPQGRPPRPRHHVTVHSGTVVALVF